MDIRRLSDLLPKLCLLVFSFVSNKIRILLYSFLYSSASSFIISCLKTAKQGFSTAPMLIVGSLLCTTLTLPAKERVIGLMQIVGHPSLNEVQESLVSRLKERYPGALRIISENAHGSLATSLQIAQKYAGIPVDLIVAISTPSAQAALTVAKKHGIPLVFTAVSDPIAAKLVSRLASPEGLVTGVIDEQPLSEQLSLIRLLFPDTKTIGLIYNPGEINSIQTVAKLKALGKDFNFIEGPASNAQAVAAAAQKLLPQVDLLYIPTDNTAVSALESLLRLAFAHKKPIVSCDPSLVKQGVLFSRGISYQAIGVATAEKVIAILEGAPIHSLDIEAPKENKTWINLDTAKRLGLSLPAAALEGAELIQSQ